MDVTVLQWNTWYKEKAVSVVDFLKRQSADIVCLQELTIGSPDSGINNVPEYISQQLGYNYYCKELPIEATDGTKLMLANGIFSRFPIKSSRFVWLNQPKTGGGFNDEFRAYVEVVLNVNGLDLTVATTHMSYTHCFEEAKNKQAETDALITEIKKQPQYNIFCGDLNALPDSYTVQSLSQLLHNAGPMASQKSWTTKPFSYNGFDANTLDWRLDYIFHTSDITMKSSEILDTDVSDHLPVLARMTIA